MGGGEILRAFLSTCFLLQNLAKNFKQPGACKGHTQLVLRLLEVAGVCCIYHMCYGGIAMTWW